MPRKRTKPKAWTRKELAKLRRHYPTKTPARCEALIGRPWETLRSKAKVLGLRRGDRRPWSKPEIKQLRSGYPDLTASAIALSMGRSVPEIYGKARDLGLEKSAAFKASPVSGRLTGNDGRGEQFRFKKGINNGNGFKKNDPRLKHSIKTRFKKGQMPHNWTPIGTVRIRSGYLARKIKDHRKAGYSRFNWQFLHLLLWEKHRGKIPAGHVVTFKDGNRSNIKIRNLELIPRSELQARNSIARFPKELRELIRLERKLNRAIEERQREKQDD